MARINRRTRGGPLGSKIDRAPSTILAIGLPWVSILCASLAPFLPIISPMPVLPPIGFMLLVAWRLLRPGLLPLWAGIPLGLFDDLFSGQPLGSAILLFSLALLMIETIELRFPWRGFWQDWLVAAMLLGIYVPFTALVSGATITFLQFQVIIPQLLLSIVLFPIIVRMVALLDKTRLRRIRRLA